MTTQLTGKSIAIMAVMIAVVAVCTMAIRVPIAATNGYINFSDVAVYFAAFAFGPWVGLVAGGVGTMLADILSGYASFAMLTFVAHGVQGLVAGYVGGRSNSFPRLILGWALGALVMVGAYYLGEIYIMGMGVAAAATEAPLNFLQTAAGGLIGTLLVYAVRKAYPPIDQIGFGKTWTEA